MEVKHTVFNTKEFLDSCCEMLKEADNIPVIISGNSMSPFLCHQRDTAFLSEITEPLKVGDIVLYKRQDESYVLHRICKIKNNQYSMIGDAQNITEPNIKREQICAVVKKVNRKGKLEFKGCFRWEFFEKIWIRIIPLRRFVLCVYKKIHLLIK